MITLRNLVVSILGGALLATPPQGFETQAERRLRLQSEALGLTLPLPQPLIKIFKGAHRLELWSGPHRIASHPVGLGHRGLTNKVREGDHLTPEGRFYIASRNRQSAFHLFLGLSYPNLDAADRGLRSGLISKAQHHAILRAEQAHGLPPQFTPLGGLVGIHGGGSRSDWTWGCIALENDLIEELWIACPLGTPVVIEP
ncbi:MAG: L,D-transpeptidase [Firmicutes bacterium]|nr:L,D-transpeptidase [Bacillota bacterium]